MIPKNASVQSILQHLAEEAALPSEIDLWPDIRVQLLANKNFSQHQETNMKLQSTSIRRGRSAAFATLLILLAAAFLLFTPQGSALAQEILRFFTHAGSDQLPVQSWQMTPVPTPAGVPTPDPASILDANLPVSVVQGQAGFDVLEPAQVPATLTFVGATFEPGKQIVRLFYSDEQMNSLVLKQAPAGTGEDCALCGQVGASAAVVTVQIGSAQGEYVEGVWKLTDSGPIWESDPYLKTMRWQANGMAYELAYMGQPDSLTQADMVAIAGSIQ
jgi:hypothetical protein